MVTATGGDKLESALAKIAKRLTNASTVQVGFPEGATEESGASIPMIAAIQEFGAPARNIPAQAIHAEHRRRA